jgi:hypothetical protein
MGYDTAGLRAGAAGHQATADAADLGAGAYARIVVNPAAFGRVPAAAGLARTLDSVRHQQGRASAAEAALRSDLAHRVTSAAEAGDGLTTTSTAVAAAVRTAGSGAGGPVGSAVGTATAGSSAGGVLAGMQ